MVQRGASTTETKEGAEQLIFSLRTPCSLWLKYFVTMAENKFRNFFDMGVVEEFFS